jgi:hypothetical protein
VRTSEGFQRTRLVHAATHHRGMDGLRPHRGYERTVLDSPMRALDS